MKVDRRVEALLLVAFSGCILGILEQTVRFFVGMNVRSHDWHFILSVVMILLVYYVSKKKNIGVFKMVMLLPVIYVTQDFISWLIGSDLERLHLGPPVGWLSKTYPGFITRILALHVVPFVPVPLIYWITICITVIYLITARPSPKIK